MSYLLIVYLIFFLVLCWRRLDWAVYLIVFALPSYLIRFSVFGLPMTLLEAMILIIFLVWVTKKSKKQIIPDLKEESTKKPIYELFLSHDKSFVFLFFCFFVFLFFATIAIFISPDLRVAAGIWKAYFIEPILFLMVFINVIDGKKLKNVFIAFSLSALALSCVAIYQKITGHFIPNSFWAAESTRRVTGIFPYPNALALYLVPILVILAGLVMAKIQEYKNKVVDNILLFYFFIILFLGLAAVYFTKSKGAIIGILAGLIFYAIFYKPYRKYFTVAIGVIVIFIFLYFYIFNIPFNLEGTPTVEGGGSLSTRLGMWQETWAMLKTKPILGAGLAGYQAAVAPFHQKDYIEIYLYPHNIFLNFWTEIGLLGLLSFLAIIGWFYRVGFKKLKNQSDRLQLTAYNLLLASMAALLVHGLVDVPYFKNDLSILFWLLVGSMIILISNKQKNRI